MSSRFAWLFVPFALILALVSCAGCALRTSAPLPNAPVSPNVDASEPGTYTAGNRVHLDNGISFTVPDAWSVHLRVRGARVDKPPRESGLLGAYMKGRGMGDGMISVFGPEADFADELATAEGAHNAKRPLKGVVMSRIAVESSRDSSATAYVNHWDDGRREVGLFVESEVAQPALIVFVVDSVPADLEGVTDEELPGAFIEYFDLRLGSD